MSTEAGRHDTAGANSQSNEQGSSSNTTPRNNNDTSHNNSNRKHKNKKPNQHGQSNTSRYVGTESTLAVLGVKNDSVKTDNFLVFQHSIENHVLSKFEHSGDIAYLIQEL